MPDINEQLNLPLSSILPPSSFEGTDHLGGTVEFFSQPVIWSSSLLFLISSLVFLLLARSVRDDKHSPYELLITFGIPFIVVCAVFAVIIAPNKDSITPIIGLLGTVAGYLLGKNDNYKNKSTDSRP